MGAGTKNEADPFVIAHAKADDLIIVTEEKRKGPNCEDKNLSIPNVAEEHGVEVVQFFEYLRHNEWSF